MFVLLSHVALLLTLYAAQSLAILNIESNLVVSVRSSIDLASCEPSMALD